jgi:hypothetical protein
MNYPDNIRDFDTDPRSPFYQAPPCEHCGQDFDECDCCESCGLPVDECEREGGES